MKSKAPRTQAFTPKGDDRHQYLLSDVPGPLWRKAKRAAVKRGVSVRALILTLLTASACGSSAPTTAPTPVTPTPPANIVISGTLTSTTSGNALAATLNTGTAQTPISGSFSATFAPGLGTIPFAITGGGVFDRQVWIDASHTHSIGLDAVPLGGGFDATFYRELVRDTYDVPTGSEPLRRWTQSPNVYLKTVDEAGTPINAAQLDATEAVIREAVPQWTSGRFVIAALQRGTGTMVGQAGWITVRWPAAPDPTACGRAQIGQSGGYVELNYLTGGGCSCGSLQLRPRTVRHEMGHAMGFWHTDSLNDLMSGQGVSGCEQLQSTRELFHAKIAYARPVGNVDPDTDPRGTVNLTPSRVVP